MIKIDTVEKPKKIRRGFFDTDINSHLEPCTFEDIPNDETSLKIINKREKAKNEKLPQCVIDADKFLNSIKDL